MSFLAIDVGNTRLKWAVYEEARPQAQPAAQGAVFLENIDKLADAEWLNLVAPDRMLGCFVSGDAVKRRVQEQLDIWDIDLK